MPMPDSAVPTRACDICPCCPCCRAPVSFTPHPQLHRVPLLARAEKGLEEALESEEAGMHDDERAYYYQAQGFYYIIKYLKAACGTAAAPRSTPAKPRRGRPPRSAGGPAAGGSDGSEK